MKHYIWVILSIPAILSLGSCNKKTETDSKEIAEEQNEQKFDSTRIEDDADFAVDAADGGMLEVNLGQLALTNGSSQKVKDLGQMMVTDHSKANEELRVLATQKNISLPSSLSEKAQKKYDDFTDKKGQEFDEAYTDLMVKDHKEDLSKFQDQAKRGKDTDLASWAATKLPLLQHHLSMAEQAEKAVKEAKGK